ncbi:SIMPL domain-containing protein [Paenibacillus sp. J5C_2022]|uniref:SIMPL domain-containing protein n=1 Tax=Paenibacillus sp. J5C2022 TaxID=2977129 RepID=UPI0021D188E9|nr:SIMPL domain-containing protein [Paenibacillus sp. J5C2022]MCU6711739.1 SIMPL domain-containing protein [Paenibacillus sp. J5C2022]
MTNSIHTDRTLERDRSFTIEVTGEGIASAAPDRAVIVLGTVTEGDSLKELQEKNDAAIAAIQQGLQAQHIPQEQIQTVTYSIQPQYDYKDGQQIFTGYKVTHLLRITLDDLEQIGRVIDEAVTNGANSVSDITFVNRDTEQVQQSALAAAMKNAEAKAMTIAESQGLSLSSIPCQIQELTDSAPPVLFKASMAMEGAGPSIQPGQLTYNAAVRVWYVYA